MQKTIKKSRQKKAKEDNPRVARPEFFEVLKIALESKLFDSTQTSHYQNLLQHSTYSAIKS